MFRSLLTHEIAEMSQVHVRFNDFELDTERCELRRSGHYVRLERLPMQLLVLLLENHGKLVRRETIVEKLWGKNVFVESEHSINTAINKLRGVLRDDSKNPRFIRTTVGQGYCFIAEVKVLELNKSLDEVALSSLDIQDSEVSPLQHVTTNGHSSVATKPTGLPVFSVNSHISENDVAIPSVEIGVASKKLFKKQWVALIGLLIALAVAIGVIQLRRSEKDTYNPLPQRAGSNSVAVLPFRNLAQSPDQDYLVDEITDQLTTELAHDTSLRVISQRSAMQYKSMQKPIQEIARVLDVYTIVEGSYLHEGQRIRITAQLLDARNDRHLWAQTYDESDQDLLAAHDRVISDIAQQIAITLRSNFARSNTEP